MKAEKLFEAVTAMQRAYDFIAANVAPGEHGKIEIMVALCRSTRHLSYEFPDSDITVEQPAPLAKAA
jgi:hypothetical protein